MDTLYQFVLLDVTVQAQLEEMIPESESDGPDVEVGMAPSVIHTVDMLLRSRKPPLHKHSKLSK